MFGERLKGNLDLLLLAVLAAAPAHGYQVLERLRLRSDGAFDLPEGTIYPALHRLESRDWVTSSWATVGGRNRRIYTLTPAGHRQLAVQRRQWAGFSAGVAAVLAGEPA